MAKFAGLVGYVTQEETVPGVWSQVENPIMMKGDVLRQSATGQNNDISLNHRISLLGDAYTFDNYYSIKWVEIRGVKWRVSSVEIQRPRLIVTLGGLWNE